LLLPILAIVFIVGWVLYLFGEPKPNTKRTPQRKITTTRKEPTLETGLTAEITEEQIAAT
jgi:hypothetical protein